MSANLLFESPNQKRLGYRLYWQMGIAFVSGFTRKYPCIYLGDLAVLFSFSLLHQISTDT
ncbi:MAG: hypothetical protein ACI92E_001349 [Oceanicoccus sp.]|jgi:hypothetical protein